MVNEAGNINQLLTRVLRRVLKPICKLCLRNSFKLGDVVEVFKVVFVEVSKDELRKSGHEISGSRISVMSGVHRKDVTRIESGESGIVELKEQKNLLAKIMVKWQHDSRYRTKQGKPRILNAEGRESEFAKLVEEVNGGNINSYATLYEMERIGAIEKTEKRVKLVWRDYVSDDDVAEGLTMLADDTYDFISAISENIFDKPEVHNLHLKTQFDNISQTDLPTIREWLLREGSLFHKRVREYLTDFDLDLNPTLLGKKGGERVVFGSFSRITE